MNDLPTRFSLDVEVDYFNNRETRIEWDWSDDALHTDEGRLFTFEVLLSILDATASANPELTKRLADYIASQEVPILSKGAIDDSHFTR